VNISNSHSHHYIHYVSKNDTALACYNFDVLHPSITVGYFLAGTLLRKQAVK